MNLDTYNLSRADWELLIDQWIIGRNAERDRAILKRRLLDGVCYQPLAEDFGLSIQRTKTIVYKAQSRLFQHIK